jgi:hypothetical protein
MTCEKRLPLLADLLADQKESILRFSVDVYNSRFIPIPGLKHSCKLHLNIGRKSTKSR